MPYGKKAIYKSRPTYRRKYAAARSTLAMRRTGVPAALYPRARTPAMALKSVDETGITLTFSSSGVAGVLPVPKLGSAFFNRLSNRTRGVSLQLRGAIHPTFSNAAAIAQSKCRIIIYYDRQANGASPAPADILLDTSNTGATNTDADSMVNINNRDRFMILRDRFVVLPEIGIDGAVGEEVGGVFTDPNNGNRSLKYEEFIKLKGLETCYNSNGAGTVADITTGAIGILAISDDASGSPGWAFSFTSRYKFLD